MATTFKIKNGDVVVNNASGRPVLIGNVVGGTESGPARDKALQDLHRCLAISRIADGSGAGLEDLIGQSSEAMIMQFIIQDRLRGMFSAMLSLQNKRSNIRPRAERFTDISALSVQADISLTTYRFRLEVHTAANTKVSTSGVLG